MIEQPQSISATGARSGKPAAGRMLDRPAVLAYLLMTPTAFIISFFVAYPFAWGVWMSLTNKRIGMPWSQVKFTALANYIDLVTRDGVFWTTFWNSVAYTSVATVIKWTLGIWLAILLNRMVRFQRQYPPVKKRLAVLAKGAKATGAQRKKAIVAVARHLAVDLWRVHTGRLTAQQLGLNIK